jgi:hypothetical protein
MRFVQDVSQGEGGEVSYVTRERSCQIHHGHCLDHGDRCDSSRSQDRSILWSGVVFCDDRLPQQVAQEGLLTINGMYNYTPMRLIPGTSGIIPGIDTTQKQLILDHHQETRTITQMATLDLNYGITERRGLQVTIPYMWRTHHHIDGLGEDGPNGEGQSTTFASDGLGDKRVGLKYNMLPTLRSLVVFGFGVYLPTGVTNANDSTGVLMEPTTQLGRKQFGLNPTIYQTYELIPHRLNQFGFASYRHTFENSEGYQFGDQWDLNGGFNLVTVPWLVLSTQVN